MRTHQLSVAGGLQASFIFVQSRETRMSALPFMQSKLSKQAQHSHSGSLLHDQQIVQESRSVRRAAKRCIIISSNALLRPGRTSRVA
ncbi:hypothetical protein BST61_g5031 [Cercospora zeina]